MHVQPSVSEDPILLESSWKKVLLAEFSKPYMTELRAYLKSELSQGKTIYPKANEYFSAFEQTPLKKVKVVILGQDPYHGPGQAHGMCFSVRPGIAKPPSLVNIFKEIQSDLGLQPPPHGSLMEWAREGVLLLNSVLTVEQDRAGSHRGKGWETFTDRVIDILNQSTSPIVFMLWGSYAQAKGQFIDRKKHCVLETVHPSPLSAYRGFLGCKHFSQANQFLIDQGLKPINWEISHEPIKF